MNESREDVQNPIKKLRNTRASGKDGVVAELIKCVYIKGRQDQMCELLRHHTPE